MISTIASGHRGTGTGQPPPAAVPVLPSLIRTFETQRCGTATSIMRKAEEAEAEDAERERFVVERAANPSRCLCGFVDTADAPMSAHLRGRDREQHRVVLPLREVRRHEQRAPVEHGRGTQCAV